jgi:putative DNA primase/helicase
MMAVPAHDEPGWPVDGYSWASLPDDLPALLTISLDAADPRALAAAIKHRERELTEAELPRIRAAITSAERPTPLWDSVADPRDDPEYEAGELAAQALGDAAEEEGRLLPSPSDPMAVARNLVTERYIEPATGALTLRHWRGGWWTWHRTHWAEREERAIRKVAYAFTEHSFYGTDSGPKPWEPTRFKIGNLLEALAAVAHLDETVDQPAWTDGKDHDEIIIAVANGLLDLGRRRLHPHTPMFFNQTAVPFAYDPEAPSPARWAAFLAQLWPEDADSVAALAEFFGYVISGRLDQHKIMLVVGPTRGGKGTIARILGKLIGPANVAGPTLSSLSFDFGLAPLLGKALAVISDARLDAQRDSSVVVERLLAISGEDTITVNRKYREQWTGKLPTRFLVISNELPRLGDASATIANRFVVLLLRESWLGREDLALEPALSTELSGILNWSLAGLDRLTAAGRFTRPASTDEAILTLQDLASPVSAFVRDRCVRGPVNEVPIDTIFATWKAWAEANGNRAGSVQTFGRNLRAVVPGLRVVQPRDGEARERAYQGIGLRDHVPPPGPETRTGHSAAERVPSRATGQEADPEGAGTQWHAIHANVGGTHSDKMKGNGSTPCDQCGAPLVGLPDGRTVCTSPTHPHARLAPVPSTPSPTPTVACADYEAHRDHHRRVGVGWTCDACAVPA